MAEQLLQRTQVGPVGQQMAGERMAQDMRGNPPRRYPGNGGEIFEKLAEPGAGQMAFARP